MQEAWFNLLFVPSTSSRKPPLHYDSFIPLFPFPLFTLMDMHTLICSTRGNKVVHEIELGIFAFKFFECPEISVSIRSGLVTIQYALSIQPPSIWNVIILFELYRILVPKIAAFRISEIASEFFQRGFALRSRIFVFSFSFSSSLLSF